MVRILAAPCLAGSNVSENISRAKTCEDPEGGQGLQTSAQVFSLRSCHIFLN